MKRIAYESTSASGSHFNFRNPTRKQELTSLFPFPPSFPQALWLTGCKRFILLLLILLKSHISLKKVRLVTETLLNYFFVTFASFEAIKSLFWFLNLKSHVFSSGIHTRNRRDLPIWPTGTKRTGPLYGTVGDDGDRTNMLRHYHTGPIMTAARTSGLKATCVPTGLSQGDNGDERHPLTPHSTADDEELNHHNNSSSIMVGTTLTPLTSVPMFNSHTGRSQNYYNTDRSATRETTCMEWWHTSNNQDGLTSAPLRSDDGHFEI